MQMDAMCDAVPMFKLIEFVGAMQGLASSILAVHMVPIWPPTTKTAPQKSGEPCDA